MPTKVLVVEDHPDFRELIAKALALIGWQTILARSGADAIDKLEYHAPDVILLDIRMPVMSGFELAAVIKKHPLHNNIPILAASADPGHRAGSMAAGCDDFISKPFAISALETRLKRLLEDHETQRRDPRTIHPNNYLACDRLNSGKRRQDDHR